MSLVISLARSSVPEKHPLPTDLESGELALNFSKANPFLSVKDSSGEIRRLDRVEVSSVEPLNATEGQLWYDTKQPPYFLRVRMGGTWVIAGSSNAAGPPLATETTAGLVRLAGPTQVGAGTQGYVVDAGQLKSVRDAQAPPDWNATPGSPGAILNKPVLTPSTGTVPTATTTVPGVVRLASQTNINLGTAGYVVDAAQLKRVSDRIPAAGSGGAALTPATATNLGGVKVGSGINVTTDGTISTAAITGTETNLYYNENTRLLESSTATAPAVTLPIFQPGVAGLVPSSPGGTGDYLRADGAWAPASAGTVSWSTITNKPTTFAPPVASASVLGGVKAGSNVTIAADGTISAAAGSLPTASATVLGGVKIGSGINIANGVISVASSGGGGGSVTVENVLTSTSTANALSAAQGKVLNDRITALPAAPTWSTLAGKPSTFTPPTASATVLGGVKIGAGITITNGVISVASSGGGGSSVNVVNALTSTSTTDALSAAQGKVLKGLIDAIPPASGGSSVTVTDNLNSTSGTDALSANQGRILAFRISSLGSGGSSVTVVNVLTSTSTTDALSAAQGKVLDDKIRAIPVPTWNSLLGKPTLAAVATSGSYNSLSNKPAIPTVVDVLNSNSTIDALSARQGKILDDKITALGSGGSSVTVIDNLNSTSGTNALSANQGRILNFRISSAVTSSDNSVQNIVKMTQAAYNALGNKVATTLYVIQG